MSMVMPVTVEERDVDRSRRGQKETFFNTNMYFYGREICFILAILITSYAALQNAPPKISKSPSPVPFFSKTSLVADFYYGQLSPAFERVSESDVSFVMYYAPWDAESQATRIQFKIVAQYFYKQVYFAAINCWQPHSECRQQFSKVQQFPVLIAYSQHNKGIQYKGIREAAHMIRFLQFVLRPLERVTNLSDVVNLMTVYDALVIGSFDFTGIAGSPGYYTYYTTALKFLERDPHREVGFAVVTDKNTGAKLGIDESPTLRIYMWNETLEYGHHLEFAPEVLVKWISTNIHQVTVWISPPGVKSLTLAPYVDEGSVLILFTPRNPLQDHNYNYNLLREVGLEYYNCDDNPWVSSFANHLATERSDIKKRHIETEQQCLLWKEQQRLEQEIPPVQVILGHWNNGSCHRTRRKLCSLYGKDSTDLDKEAQRTSLEEKSVKCKKDAVMSSISHLNYGPYTESQHEHYICCKNEAEFSGSPKSASIRTSMLSGQGDDRSSDALKEAVSLEKCRRLRRSRLLHRPIFPHPAYHRKSPRHFNGLACRNNKTLSLIAMDSLQYHQFAEGLGVDVLERHDKTAVVIFNTVQESNFILNAEFSKGALLEFISNYTDGTLKRSLRSSNIQPKGALHVYPEQDDETCQQRGVFCIPELNSNSFHKIVMDPNMAVVVLYHSPYCTFCHGISHVYLTAARYFHTIQNLTFVRIDGENNDLPWEYTMHHYPTILYFPAQRKSESRAFPRHYPITVPNLVNFILANLDPGEGSLRGMIGLCAGWGNYQDDDSARDCVTRVQRESVATIASTLKQYRILKMRLHIFESSALETSELRSFRTETHKQLKRCLYKLRHLKEVNLILGSVNRLQEDSVEYVTIQESFKRYQNDINKIVLYEPFEVVLPKRNFSSENIQILDEL